MGKKKPVKHSCPKKISEHPLLRGSYVINKTKTMRGKTLFYGCVHRAEGTRRPIKSYNINEVKEYYKLICMTEDESPYYGKKLYKNVRLDQAEYSIMCDIGHNIGLKWVRDKYINSYGIQLPNTDGVQYLRTSFLKGQTTFSQDEWNDKIGIENLKLNNYIKVGKSYYKPYSKIYGYRKENSGLLIFVMKAAPCENGLVYNTGDDSTTICLIRSMGLKASNKVSVEVFNKF